MRNHGGANPKPLFRGECIVGESGNALVAASVKRPGKRRQLEWRAAHVQCGHAMDGGLQEVVASLLPTALANGEYVVHVDPLILADKDRMGALKIILPGHRFVSLANRPVGDGNMILTVPTAAAAAEGLDYVVEAKPTYTETFFTMPV